MDCNNKEKENCQTDLGRGCTFCHCGGEAEAGMCEGCFKLHSHDWLEGMPAMGDGEIFEVRFKNTRKGFYHNANNLPLKRGDIVAVEASPGHDIGIVSLTGDIVARQMRRVGFNPANAEFRKIYRKAKPYDIEKWQEAIAAEHETMIRSRQIAADMGLNMKIGDVEYQGDRLKAIFYYIADERVDFRELIKVFASQFRIRVEMKQIGARQEAGRIGGLGSCGRELCCASWISGFVSVTTNAARHQEISLNPQKLAGQCGKLKCCLVYELDSYLDARKDIPRVNGPLRAMDGDYFHVKSDILARTLTFSSSPDSMSNLVTIKADRVREILKINARGEKIDSLQDYVSKQPAAAEPGFVNVIGEESITRFDRTSGDRDHRGKRHGRGGEGNGGGNAGPNRGGQGQNRPKEQNQAGKGQNQANREQGGREQGQRGARDNGRNRQQGNRHQGQQRKTEGRKPEGRRDGGNGNNGDGGRNGGNDGGKSNS